MPAYFPAVACHGLGTPCPIRQCPAHGNFSAWSHGSPSAGGCIASASLPCQPSAGLPSFPTVVKFWVSMVQIAYGMRHEAWAQSIIRAGGSCRVSGLLHQSQLNKAMHHYMASHLSDAIPGADVSSGSEGSELDSGDLRGQRIVDLMTNFVIVGPAFIGLFHVLSTSEDAVAATLGHNSGNSLLHNSALYRCCRWERRTHTASGSCRTASATSQPFRRRWRRLE